VTPNSVVPVPPTRPTLQWYRKEADMMYRIYQREMPDGVEACVAEVSPDTESQIQSFQLPAELNGVGGIWHELRVEVLDGDYTESTRESWHALIRDLPEGPSDIAIEAEGGGTFKVTLTA